MGERARAWGVTLVLGALVLSPLARRQGADTDDFPLSHYPMFAAAGIGHLVEVSSVRLVHADGREERAPLVAVGSPEPMVAKNIVRDAISRGDAPSLCAAVLARARGPGPTGDVVGARVVTATFDARTYFRAPSPRPVSRVVQAECGALVRAREGK